MAATRSAVVVLVLALAHGAPALAQYSEVPRPLPTPGGLFADDAIRAATQIGRRLFIGGAFTSLSPRLGGAAVLDITGAVVPGGFPLVTGDVAQIAADGRGGWILVGEFTSVEGRPIARVARVRADRHVDPAFSVDVDGAVTHLAVAHDRAYIAGTFRFVNGQRRGGLAALALDSGALTEWGRGFDLGGSAPNALAASSIAVYVAGSRIWGLDADRGAVLFARTGTARALAATSSRVYVGGYGYQRPVWAIDPSTGVDQDWALQFRFSPQTSTTGEYTAVATLLIDEGRLYIGGAVRAEDGQSAVVVADAASGARVRWTPDLPRLGIIGITRIGPAIVVALYRDVPRAFDVATAASLPFTPAVSGVAAVAAAPDGLVVGGALVAGAGVARAGLASIDLDTWTIEPWTSALALGTFSGVGALGTDGTWLIAVMRDGRVVKIDPTTGAVVAERTFYAAFGLPTRVKDGAVYVVYPNGVMGDVPGWSVGVITIADWSFRVLPIDIQRWQPFSVDVDGDTLYVAGGFATVNGESRPGLAAVRVSTGAVLPFRPAPDFTYDLNVRADGGRVWAAGGFRVIGGAWRRGLAELDPTTGAALPWNPDVPGIDRPVLDIGPDGDLFIGPDSYTPFGFVRAGGQAAPPIMAFSTATGQRRPWRHGESNLVAVLPGCVVVTTGCLPRTSAPPSNVQAGVTGANLSLQWTLPSSLARTALRLEFGSTEGRKDLYQVDLPAGQSSFTSAAPPGRYVARLRSVDGPIAGPPSDDVSFAVGGGNTAAPLSATAAVEQSLVTFAWRMPSTGAPQGYRLDVGSSPGLANLASLAMDGMATSVRVGAPPGRFWARLHAVRDGAESPPTPELLVATTPADVYRCGLTAYAPENITASASGRLVTIAWQPPSQGEPAPAGYRIEAGSAPGLNDLGSLAVGLATSFSASVPPGRYYVSLQSLDACGAGSGLSAPVTVVVP